MVLVVTPGLLETNKVKRQQKSCGQLMERKVPCVLEPFIVFHLAQLVCSVRCIFDRERLLLVRGKRAKNPLYIMKLEITEPVCLLAQAGDVAW